MALFQTLLKFRTLNLFSMTYVIGEFRPLPVVAGSAFVLHWRKMTPDKNSSTSASLSAVLKSQVLSCWERFSLERLAVTQKTLKQFKDQSPSEAMRATAKKRSGHKAATRSFRGFNNTSSFLEYWPADKQAVFQFPTLIFSVEGQADFHIADYCVRCSSRHFLLFSNGVPRPTGERSHLDGENLAQRLCTILWFFAPPGTNSVIAYLCQSQGEKHWCDAHHTVPRAAAIHFFKISLQGLQDAARDYQSTAA
jgi:hypothetical protein